MLIRSNKKSFLSECYFTLRLLISAFSLFILIASLTVELSARGYILIFSQALIVLGFLVPLRASKWRVRRFVGFLALICLIVTIIFGVRQEVVVPRNGGIFSVGSPNSLHWGEIVPERDIVLLATRILPFIGGLSFTEASGLLPSISRLYAAMDSERDRYTSPLLESLIGLPYLFDSKVLSFNFQEDEPSKRAIVFLHGVGGNWALLCWILSQGGKSIGANTYCPALGILGTWGSNRGRFVVRGLLSKLRSQGKTEIYLIAMSAGAVGASQIAQEFENELHAIALLSGSHPAIRKVQLPLLFIYGKNDERFPPKLLSWVARASSQRNASVTIDEVDGGHFFPIKQTDKFLELLRIWLGEVASDETKSQDKSKPRLDELR